MAKQSYPIRLMCKVLSVSKSAYFDYWNRAPSQRVQDDEKISLELQRAHAQSRGTYGRDRLHQVLKRDRAIGKARVGRLMKALGIRGRSKADRVKQKKEHKLKPVEAVANVLNRDFGRKQVWTSDVSYIETKESFVYLLVIICLSSRKVVGLHIADHQREEGLLEAMGQALLDHRAPKLFHTDRGGIYGATAFKKLLKRHGIRRSMSRAGNCHDNAPTESFFATLKCEEANYVYETKAQAIGSITDYILGYYNSDRIHSGIGYRTPNEVNKAMKLSALSTCPQPTQSPTRGARRSSPKKEGSCGHVGNRRRKRPNEDRLKAAA
jgi:putative transposase